MIVVKISCEINFKLHLVSLNFDIDNELAVMEHYQLSPQEFYIIRLLLLAQESEDEYLRRYLTIPEEARGTLRDDLISLQNKGVILKSYKIPNKGEKLDIYDIEFNKNFKKNIFKASGDMGEELFTHYPQFATINGSLVGLRNVSRKFNDLEDAWRKYGKIIKWNPDTHQEIINLLDWAKDNNVDLNKSLANFICDHSWLDLQALRDGGNTKLDTVKML
jgi:hypothetical protein